jgi:hypothetical protein
MNYLTLLFLFTLFFPSFLSAQSGIDDKKARLNSLNSREEIETFDLREQVFIHQYFYYGEWMSAHIFGNEDVGDTDLLVKYDILNQQLNVNIGNVAMIAPNNVIRGFVFQANNQRFICIEPKDWGKGKTFFEVIEEGEYSLLIHHSAIKQKSNYNVALDAGSKSEKVIKKEAFYLMEMDKVFEIPRKKKAAEKFFSKYSGAKNYLESNKVNFKKTEDLQKLVQYLNNKKNN